MSGSAHASPSQTRPPGIVAWAVVAVVYVGCYCTWTIAGWGGQSRAAAIGDAAFLPVSLIGAVLSWRAAGRLSTTTVRRGWRFLAAAYFCYWLGDVGWFYFDAVQGSRPYPSLADAGYLAFYPFIAAALLCLGARSRTWRDWAIVGLDSATVTLGGVLAMCYLVIDPTVAADSAAKAPWLARTLDVAYPVGDIVVVFAMALVLMGRPGYQRNWSITLLTTGLCIFVAADAIYSRMSLQGTYTSRSWVNALWMIGQAMTVVSAGLAGRRGQSPAQPVAEQFRPELRIARLPFLAVGGALGLLVVVCAQRLSRSLMELVAGVALMTALVAARQFTALHENRRLVSKLRKAVETDHLTGLASRSHFLQTAEGLMTTWVGPAQLGLLILDIDHFKSINDTHGHVTGDEVLRRVAECIVGSVRSNDLVGRLGGDEMAVLLPNCNEATLAEVAERLAVAARQPAVTAGSAEVLFTVSIG